MNRSKIESLPAMLLQVLYTGQKNLHLCKWYELHARYHDSTLYFSAFFTLDEIDTISNGKSIMNGMPKPKG